MNIEDYKGPEEKPSEDGVYETWVDYLGCGICVFSGGMWGNGAERVGSALKRWDSMGARAAEQDKKWGRKLADLPKTVPADQTKNKPSDMVNSPPHYTAGGIECIEAIEAALTPEEFRGYLKGQIFKYNWRLGLKDEPVQEAGKLAWYADRLKAFLAKCASKV